MKTMILASILVFSGIGTANLPGNETALTEVSFDKEVHDYGTIKQGSDGDCEFVITNTGKTPLVITEAHGSCGCTLPKWPKEPIKPGGSGVINVHYNTQHVGPINRTVTVTANIEGGSKILRIKGAVVAAADNAPEKTDGSFTPKAN